MSVVSASFVMAVGVKEIFMAIDYDHLMSLQAMDQLFSYSDRESLLYALSVGLGRDPLNERELEYVFERGHLKTVPTMAAVLGRGGALLRDCGWDYTKVLHAEQKLKLHQPLPSEADLLIDSCVKEAYDKGKEKGALIYVESSARLASNHQPLFTQTSSVFARADGGFGGSTERSPVPHSLPERKADITCEWPIRADQALLYRLNGDRNPLHADPALAKKVGFDVPILHGLCTYGTACVSILKALCDYDHTRIKAFDVRFSAPVLPGETITTDMWEDDNIISFQCRVAERNAVVINNGRCELA